MTDPAGGRLLGIRADMTTQAARIDANRLGGQGINRLCYVGSILRDAPANAHRPRNPTQIGAELFGSDTVAADQEMLRLMVATLQQAGVNDLHIDLGHIGVYRAVINALGWSVEKARPLYDLLQGRRVTEIHDYVNSADLSPAWQKIICALPSLHGDIAVLQKARTLLADLVPDALSAIDEIEAAAAVLINNEFINVNVHVDLIELRGYSYHTGLVFAALVPGMGTELARGGRYNSVGAAFGEARAATGFSADLGFVFDASGRGGETQQGILAPVSTGNENLHAAIAELRAQGEVVIENLSDEQHASALGCDRVLVQVNAGWQIVAAN